MVERESASLGTDGEKAIPIDADHVTMCKFDKDPPEPYQTVWTEIRGVAERLTRSTKPTLSTISRTLKAGAFDVHNYGLPPDPWATLWDNPDSKNIWFSERHMEPQCIVIGLRALDFGIQGNLRAHASAVQVTPYGFRPLLEHWSDSDNYRIGGSWLALPQGDPNFQSGYQSTYGTPKGSEVPIRRRVSFYRSYDEAPTVICWLTHIDSCKTRNHRMKVEAVDVNEQGFVLEFTTWCDSSLFELEAGWLAFSDSGEHAYCLPRALTTYEQQHQEISINFAGHGFQRPPACFLALNYIDSDCGKNTRIDVSAENITQDDMTIVARTWGDSHIFQIGFTCLALA
jgi:hypothetical protein